MGKNAEPKKEWRSSSPDQMGQCLHEEIEEILTLLAGSIRVSRRVTRQGTTRLVNVLYTFDCKRVTPAVIQKKQPGLV